MPAKKSAAGPPLKVGYVLLILALTFSSFALYTVAPWLIALSLHGPVQLSDLLRTMIPTPQTAVMSRGQLIVPQIELNPFRPGMVGTTLVFFDLESKESRMIATQIPPGPLKLLADETGLWCLNSSTVWRIQDDVVTPTGAGRTLKSFDSAFLHEGKLAIAEESWNPRAFKGSPLNFHLLVWTGTGWRDEGQILLPRTMEGRDGTTGPTSAPNEVHVLNADGQTHVFCSDGKTMQYSSHLDIIPADTVSALAVENAVMPVPGWTPIGPHGTFELGMDSHGVLRLDQNSGNSGGSPSSQLALFRLVDGKWQETERWERTGFNRFQPSRLVSDGRRACVLSLNVANKVTMRDVTAAGGEEVQLRLDSGSVLERLSYTVQNVGWMVALPVLVIYSLLASWLMTAYRGSRYEYGNDAVELASVARRTLAKLIDVALFAVPMQVAQWIVIGSAEDLKQWSEKLAALDPTVLPTLVIGGAVMLVYSLACLIGISLLEGTWGISPGKWLCGIRVVRTTLRPCGFFRAVLRELLALGDGVLPAGWLTGALAMTLTANRQRLGDLVSDTIVIRRRREGGQIQSAPNA